MPPHSAEPLPVRRIATDLVRVYRRHWVLLVGAAIVILLPQAAADAFLGDLEVEGVRSAADIAKLVAIPITVVVNLFGQAMYAGFAAAAVIEWRAGLPVPGAITLARSLPIRRLIAVDLLLGFGTAIGIAMLVVPGLVFLAYFSIAPVLIKVEHRTVADSLRRSVTLVRGRFWRVFAVIVGFIVFTEVAVQALTAPFHGLGIEFLADLGAEGLLEPFEGLVVVLVALALLDLRGELPSPRALAQVSAPAHAE